MGRKLSFVSMWHLSERWLLSTTKVSPKCTMNSAIKASRCWPFLPMLSSIRSQAPMTILGSLCGVSSELTSPCLKKWRLMDLTLILFTGGWGITVTSSTKRKRLPRWFLWISLSFYSTEEEKLSNSSNLLIVWTTSGKKSRCFYESSTKERLKLLNEGFVLKVWAYPDQGTEIFDYFNFFLIRLPIKMDQEFGYDIIA